MTRAHLVSTLCRLFCGVAFVMHGIPKIFNLQDTGVAFTEMGVPGWLAIPIAGLEFFGGLILIAGFLSRIVAGVFALEMLGAALFVHREAGWDVFQGGYEYSIALIVLLLAVILIGPGPLSVDALVGWDRSRREEPLDASDQAGDPDTGG